MTRTVRRTLLDEALSARRHLMAGAVLDVGGKKVDKRGRFRPEGAPATSWTYLNIAPETDPDLLCSADDIPVADATFDTALVAEVLEHVQAPERVLAEIGRVLRPGGIVLATMPFLFPVHGDPDDFQRWTPEKLAGALTAAGFEVERLEPMGSVAAVVFDLCFIACSAYLADRWLPLVRLALAPFALAKPLVMAADRRLGRVRARITTGYVVVARRR